MLDCLFIGDSIALGAGRAANLVRAPACAVVARVSARSADVIAQVPPGASYRAIIVSAGSNDPANPALEQVLLRMRTTLRAQRVAWLLPYDRRAAYAVTRVAFAYGDALVDLAAFASRDGVHPTSYGAVAAALVR